MSTKAKEQTPPIFQQDPVLTQLLGQQSDFFSGQLPGVEQTRAGQLDFLNQALPQAADVFGAQTGLVGGLLRGEQAPGMFGQLGQPLDESALSGAISEDILANLPGLEGRGLLSSGQAISEAAEISESTRLAAQERQRNELMNLLALASGLGTQTAALPLGQASQFEQLPFQVAGQAQTGFTGREQLTNQLLQDQFQLRVQQANADAQRKADFYNQLVASVGNIAAGFTPTGGGNTQPVQGTTPKLGTT